MSSNSNRAGEAKPEHCPFDIMAEPLHEDFRTGIDARAGDGCVAVVLCFCLVTLFDFCFRSSCFTHGDDHFFPLPNDG